VFDRRGSLVAPLLAVCLSGVASAVQTGLASSATEELPFDFDAWREHLRPGADELSWEAIPWKASLAEGVGVAAAVEKPLLLWVMNGHPLGCT